MATKETELEKATRTHGEKHPKAVQVKIQKKWMDYDEWKSTREAMKKHPINNLGTTKGGQL